MKSVNNIWIPLFLINIFFIVSCQDNNNMSLKERILYEKELDNGIEILTGKINIDNINSSSIFLKDLCDAFNAFTILNSVRNDMELYLRFEKEDAIQPFKEFKVSNISDETISDLANNYISNTFKFRNDTTGIVIDEYNQFKSSLIERFRVDKYGEMSEDIYWKEYDENRRVANFDSILELRIENVYKARNLLEPLINTETDFDKQCIYLKEYAKTFYDGEYRDERFDRLFLQLENQMNEGKYSIYLMEIWRIWRFLFQDGQSKDSPIYNKVYNKMRLVCCHNILNYIEEHPDDMMAINQFLVMASLDNINRYGEYPYGNQIVMEDISLFPEHHFEEEYSELGRAKWSND